MKKFLVVVVMKKNMVVNAGVQSVVVTPIVTPCLVVAVQPCMSEPQLKKKSESSVKYSILGN